jgi:cyanate lyase
VSTPDDAPSGQLSNQVARLVREGARRAGVRQTDIAAALGRAQSYVSIRWTGYRSWTLNEVDTIARLLGYDDAFDLLLPAAERAARLTTVQLAAELHKRVEQPDD